MSNFVKYVTAAGLVGLAVLHPQSFARIITAVSGTFRKAVTLG